MSKLLLIIVFCATNALALTANALFGGNPRQEQVAPPDYSQFAESFQARNTRPPSVAFNNPVYEGRQVGSEVTCDESDLSRIYSETGNGNTTFRVVCRPYNQEHIRTAEGFCRSLGFRRVVDATYEEGFSDEDLTLANQRNGFVAFTQIGVPQVQNTRTPSLLLKRVKTVLCQ